MAVIIDPELLEQVLAEQVGQQTAEAIIVALNDAAASACRRDVGADRWTDDTVQFPRLLAELMADGAFTSQVIVSLTESMDLEPDDIWELVERAQSAWERAKRAWVVAGCSALELDTSSSASRQHYLETGERLPVGEAETWSRVGVVSRCGDGRDVPKCQQLQAHDGADRCPVTTQSTSPTNGDTRQGATRCYVARIEWDVDGVTPREAAEAMWTNVRCSEGPVVDLLDETGFRVSVDLGRAPGDPDAVTVASLPDRERGVVLITQEQAEAWAGRPLPDEELERLGKAVPNSSIPDAIATIVGSFESDGFGSDAAEPYES